MLIMLSVLVVCLVYERTFFFKSFDSIFELCFIECIEGSDHFPLFDLTSGLFVEIHSRFVYDWAAKFSTNGIYIVEVDGLHFSIFGSEDIVSMCSEFECFTCDLWISILCSDDFFHLFSCFTRFELMCSEFECFFTFCHTNIFYNLCSEVEDFILEVKGSLWVLLEDSEHFSYLKHSTHSISDYFFSFSNSN